MDRVNGKPRLATAWLGGCAGCHMSFLDLDERLIELAARADLCYSPISDVKEFPSQVDIALVEGAVANRDHLRDLRLIRQRTRILVAFGDCAVTGNITAMRNFFPVADFLERTYRDSTIVQGVPRGNGMVPKLLDRVLRVQDAVQVDYFLPGCPPAADVIWDFILDLLAGRKPAAHGRRFGS